MEDNRKRWDAWREAEDARSRRKSVQELHSEGYEYCKQSDWGRAAERFHQAAELAEKQGDVNGQCENLFWESVCWHETDKLKLALERLLWADALGGGDAGVRFSIVDFLFTVANTFPLPYEKQEELLKKLAPYKGSGQIGGSKSTVLDDERRLLAHRGDWRGALDRAQETFVSQVDRYPKINDSTYYRALVNAYRENGLLPEAWKTLRDWRAHGSTRFANVKSWQFRAEAQLLYAEGRLGAAWDAIRRCQAEERYLNIHGQDVVTLKWLIRIGADAGRLNDACASLPSLFRFHNAESLYDQYDCFYWFAYYYAALAARLRACGGASGRYDTQEIAASRAARWYRRAVRVGRELDALLETDVKQTQLDELRRKLSEAGIREGL